MFSSFVIYHLLVKNCEDLRLVLYIISLKMINNASFEFKMWKFKYLFNETYWVIFWTTSLLCHWRNNAWFTFVWFALLIKDLLFPRIAMIHDSNEDSRHKETKDFFFLPISSLKLTKLMLPVPPFFNDKSIDALRSIFIRLGDKNLSPKLLCKGTIRCASNRGLHKSQAA